MIWLFDFFASILLLCGATFLLVGSIGLARLPDFMMRLHAPTKATTLGVGLLLIASMLVLAVHEEFSAHEILITVFLFITAPITAHMLAKAAVHVSVELREGTQHGDYLKSIEKRRFGAPREKKD